MTGIRASQKEKSANPTPLPHIRLWFAMSIMQSQQVFTRSIFFQRNVSPGQESGDERKRGRKIIKANKKSNSKGQSVTARSTSSERESSIINRRLKIAAKMEIPETPKGSSETAVMKIPELSNDEKEDEKEEAVTASSSKTKSSPSKTAPIMSMQTSPSKKGPKANYVSTEASVRTPETRKVPRSSGDLIITLPNPKPSSRKTPINQRSDKLFSPDNVDQVLGRTTRSRVSETESEKVKVNGKSPHSTRSSVSERSKNEPENVTPPKSDSKKRPLSPSNWNDSKRKKLSKLTGKNSRRSSGPIMLPQAPPSSTRADNKMPNGVSTRAETKNIKQHSRKLPIRSNKPNRNKTFLPKLSFTAYKGYKIPKNNQSSETSDAVNKSQENGENAESKQKNSESEVDDLEEKICFKEANSGQLNPSPKNRRSTGELGDRNGSSSKWNSVNGTGADFGKSTKSSQNAHKQDNSFCSTMSLTTRNHNNNIDVSQPASKHVGNNLFESLIYDCDSTVASDGEFGGATGATYVIARSTSVPSDSAILSKIQQEITQNGVYNRECHVTDNGELIATEAARTSVMKEDDEVILPDSTTPDIEMIVSKNKTRSSVSEVSSTCQPASPPVPSAAQDLGTLRFRDESSSPPDVSSSVPPVHSELSCGIEINEDSRASTENMNMSVEQEGLGDKPVTISTHPESSAAVTPVKSESDAVASLDICDIDVFEIDSTSSPENHNINRLEEQADYDASEAPDFIDTKTSQLAVDENHWNVEDRKSNTDEDLAVEEIDCDAQDADLDFVENNSLLTDDDTTSTASVDTIKVEEGDRNNREDFSYLRASFGRPKPISLEMSTTADVDNLHQSSNNPKFSSTQMDVTSEININTYFDNSSHSGAPKSDSAYSYSEQPTYGHTKTRKPPFSVSSSPRFCNSAASFFSGSFYNKSPEDIRRSSAHILAPSCNEESSDEWINWGKNKSPSSAPPSTTSNGSCGGNGKSSKRRSLDRRLFTSRSFHNDRSTSNDNMGQSRALDDEDSRTQHFQSSGIIVTSQNSHNRFDVKRHNFPNNF